jgi:hypothetical protein
MMTEGRLQGRDGEISAAPGPILGTASCRGVTSSGLQRKKRLPYRKRGDTR